MKFRTAGMLPILLAACWPVQAEQPQQGGQRGQQAAPPGWFAPPPRGAAPERAREHERMSPEERRQLRRDVTQHGREVYRERPERSAQERRGRR